MASVHIPAKDPIGEWVCARCGVHEDLFPYSLCKERQHTGTNALTNELKEAAANLHAIMQVQTGGDFQHHSGTLLDQAARKITELGEENAALRAALAEADNAFERVRLGAATRTLNALTWPRVEQICAGARARIYLATFLESPIEEQRSCDTGTAEQPGSSLTQKTVRA